MGWTSTGDPYSSVADAAVEFTSKEDAVAFAEKYGWQYSVSGVAVYTVHLVSRLLVRMQKWSFAECDCIMITHSECSVSCILTKPLFFNS